jgi:uncharacterized damage-inducible protein DinB
MTGRDLNSFDEREALLGFLDRQRAAIRHAAYGLTGEQAGGRPSASALSVAGLLKHMAAVERNWKGLLRQEHEGADYAAHLASFQPGEPAIAELLADYELAAAETDEAILAAKDLNELMPVPASAPQFPKARESFTVRWVLAHLIEETARHAGHADIVRESIDGAQALELLAAAENWPENEFVKPWRGAEPAEPAEPANPDAD